MSLPTPDAQSLRSLSQQSHSTSSTHSNPDIPTLPETPLYTPQPLAPITPPPFTPATGFSDRIAREDVSHFTAPSQKLATAGLKTLTAKRELPPRLAGRPANKLSDSIATPRSYTFPLVILACILVMLMSGGIVVFMLLQP